MLFAVILLIGQIAAAQEKVDEMEAQAFVFATSVDVFEGNRSAIYQTIQTMGPAFTRIYILSRGPLGDNQIELPSGDKMSFRQYIDCVSRYAFLSEVS